MAKVCVINFSSDKITVDGKDLEKEKQNNLIRQKLVTPNKELSPEEEQIVKDNVVSKREVEKNILQSLLQIYANENKKLSKYALILDISATIDSAEDKMTISRDEMKWFSDGFEKIPERIPSQWRFCRELFLQIDKPNEIEVTVPETKKEEAVPEVKKEEVATPA